MFKLKNISLALFLGVYALDVLTIVPYFVGKHAIFAIWLVLLLFAYRDCIGQLLSSKKYRPFWLFGVYYFLFSFFTTSITTTIGRMFAICELFSPILVYDVYKVNKWKHKYLIIIGMILLLLINTFFAYTLMAYLGANGLRDTIQSDSENLFKGAFDLVYSMAIIVPSFLIPYLSLKRHHYNHSKLILVFVALFILVAFVFVIKALFATAIITLMAGIFCLFFEGRKRWLLKMIPPVIICMFLFLANFNTILNFADKYIGTDKVVSARLYEIKSILEGQSNEASDFSERKRLTQMSWNTFTENPLLGVCDEIDGNKSIEQIGIGGHNEWVDSLAKYGLCALLLFVFIIRVGQEQIKDTESMIPIVLFVFVGFNNPAFLYMVISSVFLLIPSYLSIMKKA